MVDKSKIFNQEMGNYLASRKRHYGRFHGLPHGKGVDAKKSFEESKVEVIEGDKKISFSELLAKISKMLKKEKKTELEEEIEIQETEQEEMPEQEPTESEEEELEKLPRKGNFLKNLFLKIGFIREDVDKEFIDEYEDELETLDEDVSEMKDELKQIAKITTSAMSKMPQKELEEFKSSEDFSKFKDILRKYDLIK